MWPAFLPRKSQFTSCRGGLDQLESRVGCKSLKKRLKCSGCPFEGRPLSHDVPVVAIVAAAAAVVVVVRDGHVSPTFFASPDG